MSQVYRRADIPKLKGRNIFFDANVVLYLYFATSSMKNWPKKYGEVFSALIHNSNNLILDYNVLSEVVNRELRLNYELY